MGVLYTTLIGFGCISLSLSRKGIYILTHTWGFRRCISDGTLKDYISYLLPT